MREIGVRVCARRVSIICIDDSYAGRCCQLYFDRYRLAENKRNLSEDRGGRKITTPKIQHLRVSYYTESTRATFSWVIKAIDNRYLVRGAGLRRIAVSVSSDAQPPFSN